MSRQRLRRVLRHKKAGAQVSGGGALPVWYLRGGIALADVIAAYEPKGAASLAASYVNLATPGTLNAAPGNAPTLVADGWQFNGIDDYLTTGITAALTRTAIVQFYDRDASVNPGRIYGSYQNGTQALLLQIGENATDAYNGASINEAPGMLRGVHAIAGKKLYRNGLLYNTLAAGGSTPSIAMYLGAMNANGTPFYGKFTMARWAFYNRELTAAEVNAVFGGIAPALIFCEGDSLTLGSGIAAGSTYPDQLQTLLGNEYEVQNWGVANETIGDMAADFAADAAPLLAANWRKKIMVMWAGSNDMKGGQSGASTYTEFASACADARTAGYKVVAVTALPRSDGGTPVDFETQRATFNTSIRNNWSTFADVPADIAADGRIGDAGDELNTTNYQVDQVHLKAAGAAIVAGIVQTAVATL